MACPRNSITFNVTRCACGVGNLLNRSTGVCEIFRLPSKISTDNGIDYLGISFPETIISFDTIRKFTNSQAVFLEATLVMLLTWLFFCFFLRFTKLRDGQNIWFNLRWWISRLDVCFSTRHWLDDQQVVKKRKTELGGTLSVASWILFIGLLAALLYQVITKRTIEVHNVRATNSPDLVSFENNLEFNITAISGMSCLNLRGIGNVITGNPGFNDFKVTSLSTFGSYTCQNTSVGPMVNFKCPRCRLTNDYMYISWHFVDLPEASAAAVGFQFNFTAKNEANKKHISFVSGTLKNGSILDDRPITFRGIEGNILKFNLFPRIYHNLNGLKLIQPLFHEFTPGSNYRENAQLQASLGRSSDGIVNTTLFINYLSAYVVEIDHENILGPVSFLADLGGLYCISIGIFFYLLVQCEYRIKRFRSEDVTLRRIRSRRKALEHWDKLRRYVAYTWACSLLDDVDKAKRGSTLSCFPSRSASRERSNLESGSSRNGRKHSTKFDTKESVDIKKNVASTRRDVRSFQIDSSLNHGNDHSNNKHQEAKADGQTKNGNGLSDVPHDGNVSQHHALSRIHDIIPPPPPMEFNEECGSEMDAIVDIKKKFQLLYDYNLFLREKLMDTQSLLNVFTSQLPSSAAENKL